MQHKKACVDNAAWRAWNNDESIAAYPSHAASLAGIEYLNADAVDCTCDEHDECKHGVTGSEAVEACAEGLHGWLETAR